MRLVLLLFVAPLLTCCRADGKPVDCSDILKQNPISPSRVYNIYPFSERFHIQAFCDMQTDEGRWTVFQRRINGSLNFYRGWDQYVGGFGDVSGEHWLGLEFLHRITARRPQELLVEMEDFEGNKASARYSSFSVGGECDGYKLTVSGFTGDAGDSLKVHNNMKFSTFDKDQDTWPNNCAKSFLGAFWYSNCHDANPNGIYLSGADSTHYAVGVVWEMWKGENYSLKSISFKTRPAQTNQNQQRSSQ